MPTQGQVALAAVFAVLYGLAVLVQVEFLSKFEYATGVSLLYLPAGVKLLAIVVGGAPAIFGVGLVATWHATVIWNEPTVFALINTAIWAATPYWVYRWMQKQWLHLDESLSGLSAAQVVLIAVATTSATSIATELWLLITGHREFAQSIHAMLAMAWGDFCGIVFTLALSVVLVRQLKRAKNPA